MTLQYSNWSVDEGADQVWAMDESGTDNSQVKARRARAVQAAIASLTTTEQLIVRQFYFEGKTGQQIAEQLGIDRHTLEKKRQQAMRRLRDRLRQFAEEEFGITVQAATCVICSSPQRSEIEGLLKRREPGEPYREIMSTIKRLYGIHILSAMTIVGHCKYHL